MSLASMFSGSLRRAVRGLGVPLALLGGSLLCAGCANDGRPYDDAPVDGPFESSVRFLHEGTLELKPLEVVSVEIVTAPNATLGVLLLGDASNASLDRATVQADEAGRAVVTLTAPSQPAVFRLRAQLGNLSAELPVAVSETGFADLRVVPVYVGNREIEGWIADVVVGSSCELVLSALPADPGGFRVTSAASAVPVVPSVPVGPKIVAAVHWGDASTVIAAGCVQITLPKPGVVAEALVDVLDRPMALADAELDATLSFSPELGGYASMLDAGSSLLAVSAFPAEPGLATLLLDAMGAAITSPNDATAFVEHRETAQLDGALLTFLGGFDAQDWCVALGTASTSMALADANSSSSLITGRLSGAPDAPDAVKFALASWSGASAATLGVPSPLDLTWSGKPGDTLEISGVMPFSPTRLAGHWMQAQSASLYGASSPAQALAAELDCEAVGALVAPFGACDADCAAQLCVDAIQDRWQIGLDASGSLGTVAIALSSQAHVDGTLLPVSFAGTWSGMLSALGYGGTVGGTATGQAPPPP